MLDCAKNILEFKRNQDNFFQILYGNNDLALFVVKFVSNQFI